MPPKYYHKKKTTTANEPSTKKSKHSEMSFTQFVSAKYLIIVESPSKCTKIEHYLGTDYRCIASKGHIRELVGMKSIDTKHNYHPTFTIIEEKRKHVEEMKNIIDQFPKQNIILASDDDREGEAIAWHICQVFNLPVETTQRIIFHEITRDAIISSVKTPILVNMNLVCAQQARQVLDMIVGFTISPILWKNIYHSKANSLSAGRCQTPALRLVHENEREIQASPLETRYKTTGHFFSQNIAFELNREFDNMDLTKQFLELSKKFTHKLTLEKPRIATKKPPRPFNTSHLLQTASNMLHYSPKQTMQLCQTLYQNGHITYMRTENAKYSSAFLDQIEQFIQKEYDEKKDTYLGNRENIESKDATNPHEAIRITDLTLRELPLNADSREASLYKLIWRNTVESCMSDAKYNAYTCRISAPQDLHYSTILEIPLFLGWKKVNHKDTNTNTNADIDTKPATLRFLQMLSPESAANAHINYIESLVVVRNKHSRYTEASLIQKMEDLGIGRPSTFAMLVDTIQERGYVKCIDLKGEPIKCVEFKLRDAILETIDCEKTFGNEKNKLVIQPVGMLCLDFLIKYFNPLFSYDYTKSMEDELDVIANFDKNGNGNGSENVNPWYEICRKCSLEIQELSKPLIGIEKETYKIDDEHELVFRNFGVSIKHTSGDGVVKYKPVKSDLKVDLDKIRSGKYTLDELLAIKDDCLGQYDDQDLFIKTGKFGPYVQWGENKHSIRDLDKPLSDITIEDVRFYLNTELNLFANMNTTTEKNARLPPQQKGVLRALNSDLSIRSGKFGPYVFYKTDKMKTPQFFTLKNFKKDHETCDVNILIEWIQTTYLSK